jgi:hypothetical protein
VKTQWDHNSHRLDHTLLQVLVHHFLQVVWGQESGNVCTIRCMSASSQTRKQSNHLVGLRGDRVVHDRSWAATGDTSRCRWRRRSPCRGTGAPTCVDREVFSSNEFFYITTSRSISITTSFTLLSSFVLLSFSSDPSSERFLKKRISGEVHLKPRPIGDL